MVHNLMVHHQPGERGSVDIHEAGASIAAVWTTRGDRLTEFWPCAADLDAHIEALLTARDRWRASGERGVVSYTLAPEPEDEDEAVAS